MDVANDSPQIDLRAYVGILRRRWWIFLAVVVLVPAAVYYVSKRSPKVYQASALTEVGPTSVDSTLGSTGSTGQYILVAARLIQTTNVAQNAARDLRQPPGSANSLLHAISVSTDPNTGFITIAATASTAIRAAAIANAFAVGLNTARNHQAVRNLNIQINGILAQVAALPASAGLARRQLSIQAERLQAERAAQGTNTLLIQRAAPSGGPISPQPRRNALLAVLIAVLLALGLVALAESLDRRIRQPENLEKLTDLALLASVPRAAFRGVVNPRIVEAFRSLRTSLAFFNVDRDIRSIAVASGRKGEGKTLVATNLARAYAFAESDVILVDADLRRPIVAARLGISSGDGLAELLTGRATLAEVLIDLDVGGPDTGRLRVLPAGEIPPNPAELLGSQRMHRLIEELSTMCDVVILDTSPLLAVSDALPLLDRVSGALLVARLGTVRRDDLAHLHKVLDAATCSSLGVVATGTKGRSSNMSGYASYMPSRETVALVNGSSRKSSRSLALLGRRRR